MNDQQQLTQTLCAICHYRPVPEMRIVCETCVPSSPPVVSIGETAALEYAGKLRAQLLRLAGYAATAESENTLEWMMGLVDHLNESAIVAGDDARFGWHMLLSNNDVAVWITKLLEE